MSNKTHHPREVGRTRNPDQPKAQVSERPLESQCSLGPSWLITHPRGDIMIHQWALSSKGTSCMLIRPPKSHMTKAFPLLVMCPFNYAFQSKNHGNGQLKAMGGTKCCWKTEVPGFPVGSQLQTLCNHGASLSENGTAGPSGSDSKEQSSQLTGTLLRQQRSLQPRSNNRQMSMAPL